MNLSAIHVYPIKSCAGIRVPVARVGRRGLESDRRWMLVDPDGRFLTQREHPRMALIEPFLGDEELRVTTPNLEPLVVEPDAPGPRRPVGVWKSRTAAVDHGDRAAAWFSEALGTHCRLVRQAEDSRRAVRSDDGRGPRAPISFADGYPFLLVTEASLEDLNARLPQPIPMDRFRPNPVVEGAPAFDEDSWGRIRVGDLELTVEKPCVRCAITTVDQASGKTGREPLRTLAIYRRHPEGVRFGQNLIHQGEGTLREGLGVAVLARRRR